MWVNISPYTKAKPRSQAGGYHVSSQDHISDHGFCPMHASWIFNQFVDLIGNNIGCCMLMYIIDSITW